MVLSLGGRGWGTLLSEREFISSVCYCTVNILEITAKSFCHRSVEQTQFHNVYTA